MPPVKSGSVVNKTGILVNPTMGITGNLTRCKSKAWLRDQSLYRISRGTRNVHKRAARIPRTVAFANIYNLLL